MTLHLSTAGESHGPALVAIVNGLPAGLQLDRAAIDADLHRRQEGYGRSPRQQLERDEVEVLAGLRHGRTLGTPLALLVRNRDHKNWEWGMNPWPPDGEPSGQGHEAGDAAAAGPRRPRRRAQVRARGRPRRARARERPPHRGLRRRGRGREGAPARARDRGRRCRARDRRRARRLGGGDRRRPRRPGHARRGCRGARHAVSSRGSAPTRRATRDSTPGSPVR